MREVGGSTPGRVAATLGGIPAMETVPPHFPVLRPYCLWEGGNYFCEFRTYFSFHPKRVRIFCWSPRRNRYSPPIVLVFTRRPPSLPSSSVGWFHQVSASWAATRLTSKLC